MRNRERNNPEVPRLMRTLFADLYPVRKLGLGLGLGRGRGLGLGLGLGARARARG